MKRIKRGFDNGGRKMSGDGARPLISRLSELESELRLISSRVDNSVRLDDKVKLEKELAKIRDSVADFSSKFSGEMELSSDRLRKEIESVGKNLEMKIRDLSKGAHAELTGEKGEFENSLKKLREEVEKISREVNGEIKDLAKDVEMNSRVRFEEIENSLKRIRGDIDGISKSVVKEVNELEARMKKNSNVELDKKVAYLEKISGDFVRVEDRVRLERELSRVKENLSGVFMNLSEEVSGSSRKLKFNIEDLSKRLSEEIKRVEDVLGKDFNSGKAEFDKSLKNIEKEMRDIVLKFSREYDNLSKEVSSEIKGINERVEKIILDEKNDNGYLVKDFDKKINSFVSKFSKDNENLSKKINIEIKNVYDKLDSVDSLRKEVSAFSLALRDDEKSFGKRLGKGIKKVAIDLDKKIERLSKRTFGRIVELEDKLSGCLVGRDRDEIEREIKDLKEEMSRLFSGLVGDLKNVGDRVQLELEDFSRDIRGDFVVLAKDVEKIFSFDSDKRLGVLERERDNYLKISDGVKVKDEISKIRGDVEELSVRIDDDAKFSSKRIDERFKDMEVKIDRQVRELSNRINANSTIELSRKVAVLEKELKAISAGLDRENDEVENLKKKFEDRLFMLESDLVKVNKRVDDEVGKDISISLEGSEVAKNLNDKIREVDARVSDFEGRVDLENEKIYDRLSESLDLMMFWEKKLNRLKSGGDEGLVFSRIASKKRANQIGVIRERKKVLERLRRSHMKRRIGKR